MPPFDEKNKIEELKKSLYSRNGPDVRTRRKLRFTEKVTDIKRSFDAPKEESAPVAMNKSYEDHSMSFLSKILIASAIFFLLAIGIGAFIFLNGGNLISANNIDIKVSGPVSVAGGSEVPFDIDVVNNNNVDLVLADLSVDFPVGATDPKNPGTELKTYRELLGDIPAGRSMHKTVTAVLYGEENLQKQIEVNVSYKVKGSTSLFTKSTSYDVLLSSSPLSMKVDSVKQITSGQEFDLTVSLKSNSKDILHSILLKAAFPPGFTYISSPTAPFSGNSLWKIGDIAPGVERKVVIHGKLAGEDSDTKAFHFTAGAQNPTDPKSIGTQFMAVEQDLAIEKPFISLAVTVDNDDAGSDSTAHFGDQKRIKLTWFNNLSVPVSNVEITAKLSGTAYDKASVQTEQGYYRSATDDLVWNQQTTNALVSVSPGDSGSVYFTIAPRDPSSGSGAAVNPSVSISASVSADRTAETGVPQTLSSATTKVIKVISNASLSGRIVRNAGPFSNTGPLPPKADQPTTYTIIWTVNNTSNSLSNAQVVSSLPLYVKWLGQVSPSSEQITYDQKAGTITWAIGGVSANTVSTNRKKEVAFQVSFQPSVSQINQTPTILNQAHLTATDNFTAAAVEDTQDVLTSRFSTDPAYREGDETVVK